MLKIIESESNAWTIIAEAGELRIYGREDGEWSELTLSEDSEQVDPDKNALLEELYLRETSDDGHGREEARGEEDEEDEGEEEDETEDPELEGDEDVEEEEDEEDEPERQADTPRRRRGKTAAKR